MWPRGSHMLEPLTRFMSIKQKFKWTQVKHDYFDKLKWIMDHYTLLTYTDFNETFKIHTDASAFQLGAVISQKGKPIDLYSRKLTHAQQWYTLTERELLKTV